MRRRVHVTTAPRRRQVAMGSPRSAPGPLPGHPGAPQGGAQARGKPSRRPPATFLAVTWASPARVRWRARRRRGRRPGTTWQRQLGGMGSVAAGRCLIARRDTRRVEVRRRKSSSGRDVAAAEGRRANSGAAPLFLVFLSFRLVVASRARPFVWTSAFSLVGASTCGRSQAVRDGASEVYPLDEQVRRSELGCGQPIGCAGTLHRVVLGPIRCGVRGRAGARRPRALRR